MSLGSNVGDREKNLRAAIEIAACRCCGDRIVGRSYEPSQWICGSSRGFLNCVVEAETHLMRPCCCGFCARSKEDGQQEISVQGARADRYGHPIYGAETIDTPELQVPHPANALPTVCARAGWRKSRLCSSTHRG